MASTVGSPYPQMMNPRIQRPTLPKISRRHLPLLKMENRTLSFYSLSWLKQLRNNKISENIVFRQWTSGSEAINERRKQMKKALGRQEDHKKIAVEITVMHLRAKKCPKLLKLPRGRRGAKYCFSLRLPRGNKLCQHLDFGLLASWTIREQIFVVLSPSLK